MSNSKPPSWWSSADLQYDTGRLRFGDRFLDELASQGTPLYILRPQRAIDNLLTLRNYAPDFLIYYAIKANRNPVLIEALRKSGVDGIDVCSPREAQLALKSGFRPEQISYTGTSVSKSDLLFLARERGIHVNADSLAGLRRLLEAGRSGVAPRAKVGVRINLELGLGYRQESRLVYSGPNAMSKFGILPEQIPAALELARQNDVAITTLHWHVGCGWLGEQQEQVAEVVRRGVDLAEQFPDLERINLGGGLGVPLAQEDSPVDLAAWSDQIRHAVAGRWQVMLEPGAFLTQNTTILIVEVCTVENKRGQWFVGINSGFNLLVEPVFYGMPAEIVPLREPGPDASRVLCRFAGNINEGHDMLPLGTPLPLPEEGDYIALLNAGAYGTSMASDHCLRGQAGEVVVD
ncbi:MAG: alanine racemase [Planctomycetia bacterium]|nr:alanine racemase [Planctomycetia bacterium]